MTCCLSNLQKLKYKYSSYARRVTPAGFSFLTGPGSETSSSHSPPSAYPFSLSGLLGLLAAALVHTRFTSFLVGLPDTRQNKKRIAGQTTSGDDMKYEDPKMEEYWNTLPDGIQSLINESGIDICSLGMLMKLGDYYKNGHAPE